MDQSMDTAFGKTLYVFLGFAIPLIMLAVYMLLGWGNLALVIVAISWLGFAILFYMGLTDEETSG
ncbi:MAG: hypothetical protein R6W91_00790 [Thermoplasmata archaeon]